MRFNIASIIEYSNVVPFRLKFNRYRCFYCETLEDDFFKLKQHTVSSHRAERQNILKRLRELPIRLDVSTVDCKLCSDTILDIAQLKQHLKSQHNKPFTDEERGYLTFKLDGNFECHLCSQSFGSFRILSTHMNEHFEKFVVRSRDIIKKLKTARHHCGDMRFNIASIIEYSHVVPFRLKLNSYRCFYCGILDDDFLKLKEHTLSSHRSERPHILKNLRRLPVRLDVSTVNCKLCPDTISNIAELKQHLKSKHNKPFTGEERGYFTFKLDGRNECHLCSQSFGCFKVLSQHMNEHFENYVCDQCGKGFMSDARLNMHMRMHETGTHPCSICSKSFNSMLKLRLHVEGVHEGRLRFKCPHCEQAFNEYTKRQRHLVAVHGYQPFKYPCELCGKVLATHNTLVRHHRREHLGLRNATCNECGKQFFSKKELTDHLVTHGSERIFKCGICRKTFPLKKRLMQHMKMHMRQVHDYIIKGT